MSAKGISKKALDSMMGRAEAMEPLEKRFAEEDHQIFLEAQGFFCFDVKQYDINVLADDISKNSFQMINLPGPKP